MPSLRHDLAHYLDHLQDVAWITDRVEGADAATLLDTVADVVGSGTADEIFQALTFVRDVGVVGLVPRALTDRVSPSIVARLYPALRRAVTDPRRMVRYNAIYTLGKLGFEEGGPLLLEALEWSRGRDPLTLKRALDELSWLGQPDAAEQIEQVIACDGYLFRWALLNNNCLAMSGALYDRLADDPVSLVRAEAVFEQRDLAFRRSIAALSQHEKRARRRTWQNPEPAFRFSSVSNAFENAILGRDDVTYDDFDRFVQTHTASR